jgi:hypothetical protein
MKTPSAGMIRRGRGGQTIKDSFSPGRRHTGRAQHHGFHRKHSKIWYYIDPRNKMSIRQLDYTDNGSCPVRRAGLSFFTQRPQNGAGSRDGQGT